MGAMSQTLLERLQKSKTLFRKVVYPHTLVEIDSTEGMVECATCGGIEGTLLHDCPGYWCANLLDEVYRSTTMSEISSHWHILLIRANKRKDEVMLDLIRSTI